MVCGENGIGEDDTDKMVRIKWYGYNGNKKPKLLFPFPEFSVQTYIIFFFFNIVSK